MKVFHSLALYQDWRRSTGTAQIGFVPTMGALHIGHESLLQRSVAVAELTVLSIYVNPTQFDNPDDLQKYPNLLEQDLGCAERAGVDAVLLPTYGEMYADGFRYAIEERELSKTLCGAHRDGHFTGVLTVVMKLLNIVQPRWAFFGEKDYQQFELIRGMVEAFFLPVEVVPCATVREASGLAFSSRNLNLDAAGKRLAPKLYALISSGASDAEVRRQLTASGFVVDYIETRQQRRYAAARLGQGPNQVRLIDNVPVVSETPVA
jgi:pantoate--beta-alanine ligase